MAEWLLVSVQVEFGSLLTSSKPLNLSGPIWTIRAAASLG